HRHTQIHEYDVGAERGDPAQGLVAVRGLPHHVDVVTYVQERRERLTKQRLVVDEQYPYRRRAHPGTSTRSVAPQPGIDSRLIRPPTWAARSRRPTRPKPGMPSTFSTAATPVPSSRISRRTAVGSE